MASTLPLDALRRVSNAWLPQTCAVRRYVEVNTPDGVEQTWSIVASGIACRVSPRAGTAAENVGEAAGRAVSEWTVWVPWNTDVTERDRLVIDPPDARTFEASRVGVRSFEVIREVLAVLVE